MSEREEQIKRLQREIDHLFEFGDFFDKEDNRLIYEKTNELMRLQKEQINNLQKEETVH